MNYKIYIESLNNFPIGDWGVSALQGFRDKQADIVLFEDIEEVPKSPYNILVACIETTNKYLERFGIGPKKALNIPTELEDSSLLKRKIWRSTMGDLRHGNKEPFPFFVKPDGRAKEFVAGVVSDADKIPYYYKDIPDDSPILCSEVIPIVSEYRVYVIEKRVVGIKWYSGDHFIFPSALPINIALMKYKSAPSAYGIDFAVLKNDTTVLVEVNDGWSLGNYGLEHTIYSKLLATRWRELMREAGYNV